MFKRIMIALDGSRFAERSLPVATRMAVEYEASITLVHAVSSTAAAAGGLSLDLALATKQLDYGLADAETYLGEMSTQLKASGVAEVHTHVLCGTVVFTLLVAEANDYDLVVMSTHGRTGLARTVLGSVAAAVISETRVPVLLVSSHQPLMSLTEGSDQSWRILVPLDGTPFAEQVLPLALASVGEAGTILLLRVTPDEHRIGEFVLVELAPPYALECTTSLLADIEHDTYQYLREVAERYLPDHVPYGIARYEGKVAAAILRAAGEHRCNLIVMATHAAHSGLNRLLHGSVSEQVVAGARVPVLLLHGAPVAAVAGSEVGR